MILELFVPYDYNGGQSRYFDLTRKLVEMGHSVDILSMKYDKDKTHEEIDDVNIYYMGPVIKSTEHISTTNEIMYSTALTNWLRKHDYDLIDTPFSSSIIPVTLIARRYHTPVINTIIDTNNNFNLKRRVYLSNPFSKVMTVTNPTMDILVDEYKINDKKILNTPIGIDLERIDDVVAEKDKNRVIYVGKLIESKNICDLLKAINMIKSKINDIKLVIIGKGSQKNQLVKYIEKHDLEDNVEFMENLSKKDLIYQLKIANCLVQPSTIEKFGVVLLEANACRTPAVAYDSPGARNVIINSKNGYIVEPGDIDDLAHKIEYILSNNEIEEKLATKGRKNIEDHYNLDNTARNYVNYASKLLNQTKNSIRS